MFRLSIILCLLICCYNLQAQNVLDGVYRYDNSIIRNGESLKSFISGNVIDSKTLLPINNATVELLFDESFSDDIRIKSDSNGSFIFQDFKFENESLKIVCYKDSIYEKKLWKISTYGMSRPIQITAYFELEEK